MAEDGQDPEPPQLRLWGAPRLLGADGRSELPFAPERRFQLLALLGLQAGLWVERERLAALLWPSHGASEARRNLRKVVFAARALAGAQGLEASSHALRWSPRTDLQSFERALSRGDLDAALALRRGPPLDGIDDPDNPALSDWLAAQRTRLEQAWLTTAQQHLRGLPDAGARAVAARRMLAVDALDEPALQALLQAEQALGRPAEAQAAYRHYAVRLAQDLGVEPSRALRETLNLPATAPAEQQAPPAAAGFVGRRHELAQLRAHLADRQLRVLTLLGPGGIGKSRLARELLHRVSDNFPGGCHLVDLQEAPSAAVALAGVAQVLGQNILDSRDPVAQMALQLPTQRALLVLDNAEHLPELAEPLARLISADTDAALMWLVTSRVRLAVNPSMGAPRNSRPLAEHTLALQGLALPDEDSRDLEAASAFDAVRLFERRAHAARPDFSLARHLPAALDIVEAVAGLPLAIELAAAWVRLLPPEQVAADLRLSIDLLEHDPASPAQPARPAHASLRAVVAGSWDLLAPREREALAALSVFQGGFLRAAAQAVAGCSLPLLSSLADKSLLAVDETGRFSLHPVVAAFAAERLSEQPERGAPLRQRHAEHHARLLETLAPQARADQRRLLAGVLAERANLVAAWNHAVETGWAAGLRLMAPPLGSFHDITGRLLEGMALLRPALALPPRDALSQQALARVRAALAALAHRKGDLHEAQSLAEGTLALAEQCGERSAQTACLGVIGLCLWNGGRSADALPPLQRALLLAQEDGDRHAMAMALSQIALAEKALGHFEPSLQRQQQALALHRELGDQPGVAARMNHIGNLHRSMNDWAQARHWFEQGLAHCREHGVAQPLRGLRLNLGLTLLETDGLAEAARILGAVLGELRASGQTQLELAAQLGLARAQIGLRQFAEAQAGLVQAVLLARAKGFKNHPAVAASIYGELLVGQGRRVQALALWLMTEQSPDSDEMDRQGARTLIERLAPSEAERAQALQEPPTLEQVLQQMGAGSSAFAG